MKKLTILFFAMASLLARAQSPGITLDSALLPNYMRNCMNWSYDDWYNHEGETYWESSCQALHPYLNICQTDGAGMVDFGVEYTTDRPIKIIGAAAVARMQHWADTATSLWNDAPHLLYPSFANYRFPNTLDTTVSGRLDEYLRIYQPSENGDPVLLTEGSWRIEDQHRYIHLPGQHDFTRISEVYPYHVGANPSAPFHNDTIAIEPIYEVFFDKPVVVEGSFIVMGTNNNNSVSRVSRPQYPDNPDNPYLIEWMYLWDHNPTRYWSIRGYYVPTIEGYQTDCLVNWQHFHDSVFNRYDWTRYVDIYHHNGIPNPADAVYTKSYLIYPIIDPTFDTLICDEINSVHKVESSESTLTVMWTGGNNIEWEVKYVRAYSTDTAYLTTSVPTVTLTGLRPYTEYMVSVRGRCDSTRAFGLWSEPEGLRTDRQQQPQRIAELDRVTQLMPNPASGDVNVVSYYLQNRVVVYDLKGNKVLERQDPGSSTTFSVSSLPKGVYVVAIHTPAGIATKRLVVE